MIFEQNANGSLDFQRDLLLCTLSEENLLKIFYFLGNQVCCLWNTFLNFHRFAVFCTSYDCIQTSVILISVQYPSVLYSSYHYNCFFYDNSFLLMFALNN